MLSEGSFYAFLAVAAVSDHSVCVGRSCLSPTAALFLLGWLWHLFCLIFQFIFVNFEQPWKKGSKLAGYFPRILLCCAVCLDKHQKRSDLGSMGSAEHTNLKQISGQTDFGQPREKAAAS